MAVTTNIKNSLNTFLKKINIRIDTYTALNFESNRIERLKSNNIFNKALYEVPNQLSKYDSSILLNSLRKYNDRYETFKDNSRNDVNYSFTNDYYTSPDTEILYAMIRNYQPKRIIEIGCGNSTKISRQAILDGKLNTKLISIDPHPRIDISVYPDILLKKTVEEIYFENKEILFDLEENDIFFIDSSHQLKIGNDVAFLYNLILPKLPKGVIIHIHDIYLPYEYPLEIVNKGWEFLEQYLLHSMLVNSERFDLLWAGFYTQKHLATFDDHFPNYKGIKPALSFWIKIRQ